MSTSFLLFYSLCLSSRCRAVWILGWRRAEIPELRWVLAGAESPSQQCVADRDVVWRGEVWWWRSKARVPRAQVTPVRLWGGGQVLQIAGQRRGHWTWGGQVALGSTGERERQRSGGRRGRGTAQVHIPPRPAVGLYRVNAASLLSTRTVIPPALAATVTVPISRIPVVTVDAQTIQTHTVVPWL